MTVRWGLVLVVAVAFAARADEPAARVAPDSGTPAAAKLTGEPAVADLTADFGGGKASCEKLAEQTRTSCRDQVLRGFDGGCVGLVTAVELSRKQASGQLLDLAGSNADIAGVACRVQLGAAKRRYEKHADTLGPEDGAGPLCRAFAEKLDELCWPALGERELPPKCLPALQAALTGTSEREREGHCQAGTVLLLRE